MLVELGQSGGPNPHAPHPITSLLARELADSGFDTSAWADLAPVVVPILHPGRTLLEKLLRVNNFAASPDAVTGPHGWPRIGRQLYDIAASLAFKPGSPSADRLRAEHDAAMRDLYYGSETPPTFDDVLAQVHADAALLDV